MGMDITMNAPPTPAEVQQAGLDKDQPDYFRFNWGGMHAMVMAMVAAGALAEDDKAPALPPWPPKGMTADTQARFEAAYGDPKAEAKLSPAERTQLRALRATQQRLLATHSKHKGMVPAYKFLSNEGWIVAGDECRTIATRLRAYAKRVTQKDLDALGKAYADAQRPLTEAIKKEGEITVVGNESLGISVDEFRTWAAEWAAYNEVAAKHGGYHID